jgi:hypothetical protein
MMQLHNRREGHEELNLDVDGSLDNKVYRDAYRELIKSKLTQNVTYNEFLRRMKERNIASRRKEFERRSIVINEKNAPLSFQAMKETKAACCHNSR